MSETTPSPIGTAVVTGASSGIGKVYAARLAERGYNLLLIARRADRLQAIGEDLQSRFSIRVESLIADLADPDDLSETAQRLSGDPSITMLVNNAGTSAFGHIQETSPETLSAMVALNVTALSVLTRAVLPGFLDRGAGTIVNIGSVVGYAAYPGVPVYGPTKAYVLNFTQTLQKQLAGTAIRVQLVTPSATVSEIWDHLGVPLSSLDPAIVMTTEDCVDAALRGLDNGELITSPSLQDDAVLRKFLDASESLLQATQLTGQPASRYGLHA